MDIERIEKGVRRAFDKYELFFLKERRKKYETRDKELSGAEVKVESGVALRAIKDDRMVFSYTFEDEEKAAAALVENAATVLPFLEQDRDRYFPGKAGAYRDLGLYDTEGLSTDDGLKTALLIEMERTILEYDGRIQTTRNCELQETAIEAAIVNSEGLRAEARKTLYTLMGMCVAKDADEASWFDWTWAHSYRELDGAELGRRIAGTAVSLLSATQLETGVYDGILTSQAACDLLEVLSSSFLAENLYKKKTRLAGKEGTACFSPSTARAYPVRRPLSSGRVISRDSSMTFITAASWVNHLQATR
jgi:PmbA protein